MDALCKQTFKENSIRKGYTMKQIIMRDGKVLCVTTVPYPKDIVKQMKKSGYKVIEKE